VRDTEADTEATILMQDGGEGGGWLRFRRPRRLLIATRADEVWPLLDAVERAVEGGLAAAGFLTYEAAAGLDPACRTHSPGRLPLAWFALCEAVESATTLDAVAAARGSARAGGSGGPGAPEALVAAGSWSPSIDRARHDAALHRIRRHLADGDTYQVNFTHRLRAPFDGDPLDLFLRLARGQRSPSAVHAAFIETPSFAICSASPELFFALDGERLVSRPMKGTSRRGLTYEEDAALARALVGSPKERAENVMITDMVRNDLGRIARHGSVRVEGLFEVERFPTVLQLTSTVSCRTAAPLAAILAALFPCASITGAPKVRTMEIIRDLECSPRGIYTGCIGYLRPGRRAHFSVAIRTVHVDRATARAEYGVGGGIVWDSRPTPEYQECRVKAAVLQALATPPPPRFRLLETLRWESRGGYWLLDQHLERLRRSATYFDFALDTTGVRERLIAVAAELAAHTCDAARVRLLVSERGRIDVTWSPLAGPPGPAAAAPDPPGRRPQAALRVALAPEPVRADDRFLYHKTTHRAVYERARAAVPGVDDVLLWNEQGEVTESTIANLIVERHGRRLTPPVRCGLLPGTMRAWLLERGAIEEAPVRREELELADRLFLVNAVRGWMPCRLVGRAAAPGQPRPADATEVTVPARSMPGVRG
jgi:para-aminobenzoate synthetase/4-amino-4-deoxychorismate lyase